MSRILQDTSWLRSIGGTILMTLLVAAVCFFGPPLYWTIGNRICDNVYVEDVLVGGMRPQAAQQVLSRRLQIPRIRVTSSLRNWYLSPAECGASLQMERTLQHSVSVGRGHDIFTNAWAAWRAWYYGVSIPLEVRFKPEVLRQALQKIAWTVNVTPTEAKVQWIEGSVYVMEGRWGRGFDVATTAGRIATEFGLHNQTISAEVKPLAPRVTAAELQDINAVIASFTTRFNPGKVNRTRNIRTACAQINGSVVMPGETFSFNAATGERTVTKGYRVAQIYDRHEIVDGVGGGVCQVSTTLYNCARKMKLPIVERHPHSLPVPYVRTGLDATVAYPYRDLKFTNNLPTPIALWTIVSGSRLTVCLLGQANPEARSEASGSVAEAATGNN